MKARVDVKDFITWNKIKFSSAESKLRKHLTKTNREPIY